MSEKLDALVKKLKESGHHGFYNDEGPCGCSWNDMAPCGECPIEQGCVGGFIGPPNGDGFDLCDYMIYPTQEAAAKAAAQVTGFCAECERREKEKAEVCEQRRLAVAYLSDCVDIISELGGGSEPSQTATVEAATKFLDRSEDEVWESSRLKAAFTEIERLRGVVRDAPRRHALGWNDYTEGENEHQQRLLAARAALEGEE